MNVTRIYESPRVTLPYTDEQWAKIESLGHAIDADLKKGDVRLTMGGEPTFVSIDDPDGAGMEFHRRLAQETHSVRRTHQAAAPKIRARLAAALRPGQMVSRRTAAALGARLLTGARTACRSGRTIRSSPMNRRITATARRRRRNCSRASPKSSAWTRNILLPAYEDAFYYTVEGAPLPVERHAGKIQSEGQAGARPHRAAFSSRVSARSSATRCRSSARGTATSRAGCPARGFCATTTRSGSFPAIRRWACACRSIRFRGWRKRIIRGSGSRTRRSRNCRSCRRNFRIASATGTTGQRFLRGGGAPLPAGYGPGQRAQQLGELEEERAELPPAAGVRSEAPSRCRARARRGSSAPRCASNRATGGCTFSCRRWRRRKIISI